MQQFNDDDLISYLRELYTEKIKSGWAAVIMKVCKQFEEIFFQ